MISTGKTLESVDTTYTLIIDNDHFLDTAVPTKLVIQVPFRGTNAQTKYAQHVTRIRSLGDKSISKSKERQPPWLTMGA